MHSQPPPRIVIRPLASADHRAITTVEKESVRIDGTYYLRCAGWLDPATVEVLRRALVARHNTKGYSITANFN